MPRIFSNFINLLTNRRLIKQMIGQEQRNVELFLQTWKKALADFVQFVKRSKSIKLLVFQLHFRKAFSSIVQLSTISTRSTIIQGLA